MRPGQALRGLAVTILVINAIAAVVAIVVNLPSQFGIVGTDARSEFLTNGTAISAPLLPVLMLVVVAVFAGRADRLRWIGIVVAYLTAATVAVGGVGELVAEPTADTPKAVLVGAGIVWIGVAVLLAAAATAAATGRPVRGSRTADQPPQHARGGRP